MSDRELLEFAAKAAGMPGKWSRKASVRKTAKNPSDVVEGFFVSNPKGGYGKLWNPLTDDGDALRLAVTLGLVVDCSRPSAGEPFKQHHVGQVDFQDQQAATRRAIVRAAAAIGKEMP